MLPLHILKYLWKMRKAKKAGESGVRNLSAGEMRAADVIKNHGPGLLGGAGAAVGSAGLGLFALNQDEEGQQLNSQSVIAVNNKYGYPGREEPLTQADFPTNEDYDKYMIELHNNRIMY